QREVSLFHFAQVIARGETAHSVPAAAPLSDELLPGVSLRFRLQKPIAASHFTLRKSSAIPTHALKDSRALTDSRALKDSVERIDIRIDVAAPSFHTRAEQLGQVRLFDALLFEQVVAQGFERGLVFENDSLSLLLR